MPSTLRNADTCIQKGLSPFFRKSSNYQGRRPNSQKISTEPGRWKHLAPMKRKLKSDSSARCKPQQQFLQEIHIPRTHGQEAAGKYEHRDYKTGRKSRHTLLQPPTTALSSGLWNFYIIHLCICPVAPNVKRGSWQSTAEIISLVPSSNQRSIPQNCPNLSHHTKRNFRFQVFSLLCISKNPVTWSI